MRKGGEGEESEKKRGDSLGRGKGKGAPKQRGKDILS